MLIDNGNVVWNKSIEQKMLDELAKTCKNHSEPNCLNCQLKLTDKVLESLNRR